MHTPKDQGTDGSNTQTPDQPAPRQRKQRSDKGVKRGPRKSKVVDNSIGAGD